MVNVSTLGQYLDQISRLKTQQTNLGDLSIQISSGLKTQKLSGLGAEILKTTRARTSVGELSVYNENIINADRRLKLMDTSLREMKAQLKNVAGSLSGAIQQGDYPDLESIQKLAGSVYDYMINLMNQKDGDRYLFGGSDNAAPPISNNGLLTSSLGNFVPDSSDLTNPPLMASGLIGDWGDGTITTEQFIASYSATSDTVIGFSNALTSGTAGKTTVRVDDVTEYDYTTLANKTPMRDVMLALGVLKSLPAVEYAPGALNDPTATTIAGDTAPYPPKEKQESFFAVINDLSTKLNKALDRMDQEEFRLAQVRAQISLVKDTNTEQIAAYKDIIGDIENADITEASAKILQVQTQLTASFQVTALMSQLTLASFLR